MTHLIEVALSDSYSDSDRLEAISREVSYRLKTGLTVRSPDNSSFSYIINYEVATDEISKLILNLIKSGGND